jgi:hypothetical protein
MPFGALVATAHIVACLHIDRERPDAYAHLKVHEHAHGPWCWVLSNVSRIQTFQMRGFQGLWYVPREVVLAVLHPRVRRVAGR